MKLKIEQHETHYEIFEDTKVVIRSRQTKKDRQYNGQNKKDKRTKTQTVHRKLKIHTVLKRYIENLSLNITNPRNI